MQLSYFLTLLPLATASIISRQNGAADFGSCDPSIDFQLGRNGRDADEGTFLPTDAAVAEGQSEALNRKK